MEPLFTWLHLSDIHVGHGDAPHGWDQQLVLDRLLTDVRGYLSLGIPKPDAIFVTGDLAFSGNVRKDTEYKDLDEWLTNLSQTISVEKDRIFLVPGNHDVQRDVEKKDNSVDRLLKALRSGEEKIDDVLANPSDRALLLKRMQNYFNFAENFAFSKSSQTSDDADVCWVQQLSARREVTLRIIGLNTALLCADDQDHGKLQLGKKQLAKAFLPRGSAPDELIVVLSHHPFNWLKDERDTSDWVKGHAHIQLCGHIHEAHSERVLSGGGQDFIRIVSGAVHDESKLGGIPVGHGYYFGTVWVRDDGNLVLRIWPRSWSQPNRDFRLDVDNVPNNQQYADHDLPTKLSRPAISHPAVIAEEKIVSQQPPPQQSNDVPLPTGQETSDSWEEMWTAFHERRIEDAAIAFDNIQCSETDDLKRLNNRVLYLAMRFRFAKDPSALEELERLSENPEIRPEALSWIGHCYELSGDFDRAQSAYQEAVNTAPVEEKVGRMIALANCRKKSGSPEEALSILEHAFSFAESIDKRAALYKQIASIQEALGNPDMRAIALEKTTEEKPADTESKFNAAYALSETQFSELSAFNYDNLLHFDLENSAALNNLAVQFHHLGMPIQAISFFNKAADYKETLAMADLAYRFLEKGFFEEARAILEKAKAEQDVHPNVGQAIAALADAKEKEKKIWKAVEETAIKQKNFLRHFAEAWFVATDESVSFDGEWTFPDGQRITISQVGQYISGIWDQGDKKQKLNGNVHNRGVRITLQKWQRNFFNEGGFFGSDVQGYAYVNKEGTEFSLMTVGSEEKLFLRLKRG